MTKAMDIWAALDAALDSIEPPSEEPKDGSSDQAFDHRDQIFDHSDPIFDHPESAWSKDLPSIPATFDHFDHLDHENKGLACARDAEEKEQELEADTPVFSTTSVSDGRNGRTWSKPAETLEKSFDHRGAEWSKDGEKWSKHVSIGGNIYSLDAARTFRQAFLAADLPSPKGDDLNAWRTWMRSRAQVWMNRGRSKGTAIQIAWGEAQNEWRRRHGAEPNPNRCAGCGSWLMDEPGMSLPDGARVHVNLDCMAIYGNEWREAAAAGLIALGINPPADRTDHAHIEIRHAVHDRFLGASVDHCIQGRAKRVQ
jgi:hypothetical protein